MDRPAKKPVEVVMDYLTAQGLTPVEHLDDIQRGNALIEVTGDGNEYCDLYITIARSFKRKGEGGTPEWNLAGKYAWAWVPDSPTAEPHHEITRSNKHLVNAENLATKTYFLITEQESPLGKIAAKIRE